MFLRKMNSHISNMKVHGFIISGFNFTFNGVEYPTVVSIAASDLSDYDQQGILCAIIVVNPQNDQQHFNMIYSETNGLRAGKHNGDFYDFFGIDTNNSQENHFGRLIGSIGISMNEAISPIYTGIFPAKVKAAIRDNAANSDPENPNKKYCIGIRLNPQNQFGVYGQRSEFNTEKTHKMRPDLFALYANDSRISFLYSENPDQEKTDSEIVLNFNQNQANMRNRP
ncbi:DUF6037 family protein [Latilactobacillus sakei]|uniref:DUF6037 family protein n=1 Tax=Latilactobacillus sakei TaxID=1599 RepID=UPI000CD692C3|nr:DUF6037 family protein [Latilactobacillus sakei]AUX11681.1 hypothetical protein C0213_04440 [Latilactobacillus sakei]MCM1635797.1 DUF6037 family protein [Latilactobacillus sakei]